MNRIYRWASLFLKSSILMMLVLLLSIWLVPLPERLSVSHSTMLLYRDGTPAHVFLAPDDRWRVRADLSSIDEQYVKSLLSIEDKRYSYHLGVDPLSVMRAMVQNILAGEIVSGASTITMQLVRVVESRPRTFRSKIIESWRALQLEVRLSKEEILTAYLTFIPFGRNIEGIEAASMAYFGHRPNKLEADEIAILIAVPQNPNARYPSERNNERLRQARDHVARLLLASDALPIAEKQSIQRSIYERPLPKLKPFPRGIPHLAMQIKRDLSAGEIRKLTLDAQVQHFTEVLLKQTQSSFRNKGIDNAAIVVADWKAHEIRAIVGGFDFWDGHDGSEIPAYRVPRSSGSTLKPFLYASAIDKGIATPARRMEDLPLEIAGYKPRNYNELFNGMVSLKESLSRSLNVPFVLLLKELKLNYFLSVLNKSGIHSFLNRRDELGLSVAVGVDLTPLELTEAYSIFPNRGIHAPLTWTKTNTVQKKQVFSEAASWLTEQSLQLRARPDFPERRSYVKNNVSIAWKTGTSFGLHDAWSVGWAGDLVATVWLGNLSYRSSAALIGSEAAAPILFDLLEGLVSSEEDAPRPSSVTSLEVCSYSGLIPTQACPALEQTYARVDRVPIDKCTNHYTIEVDKKTGLRVAPTCRMGPIEKRSVLLPSSQMLKWSKLPSQLPEIAPQCRQKAVIFSGSLELRSPESHRTYFKLSNAPEEEHRLPLQAEYADVEAPLYWYVNGRYWGTSTSQETLWWNLEQGSHRISVEDGQGHLAEAVIQIREL
ncbi:MAG: penicillin-binding protein 1C [Proteobacteria bacterium]|nr:penicillin-binding protein 1C [Pseudomonadota bacterium]